MLPTSEMPSQYAGGIGIDVTRSSFITSPQSKHVRVQSHGDFHRICVAPSNCVARSSSYTPQGSFRDLTRRSHVPPTPSFYPPLASSASQTQLFFPSSVDRAPVPPIDLYHDLSDKMLEPWLEPEIVQSRRASMGLDMPRVSEFASKCEFISLGNFCGIAQALQAIDVKQRAYPFDWVRSPVDGIIHCFESNFEDFLTFSMVRDDEASKLQVFTGSRWGGAFWHHNPLDPKTKADCIRRIERMLALGDVPASKPRFFVRAVNSTSELRSTMKLKETLQRALPNTTIYLLVLIDFQIEAGPLRLEGDAGKNILLSYP